MTNYSRSVLKSNGLHHSKNPPVKFGFSPKTVSANIVKKLPPQRCFKPLFIAFFNFSHKWPTLAFTCESGHTLGSRRKIAHSGSHGETRAFPPSATARSCAASEIATERTAGGSGCTPMACVRFLRRRGPAGLRDLFRFCRNCGLYALRSGLSACARHGWYHYPQCALRVVETLDDRLSKWLICRFLRSDGHH